MGREHDEDGAKTKPKHITFDQTSLDGSDEDDGAVEVSVMPFAGRITVQCVELCLCR